MPASPSGRDANEIARRRAVAEEAARVGGAVHHRYRRQTVARDVKGDRTDYATKVDYESQSAARDVILRHFPGETVVGEEDAPAAAADLMRQMRDGVWLIDPLDGTLEFVHNGPLYSCVVSYVVDGAPVAGVCYFEAHDEMFSAAIGQGATYNGAPMRTTGTTQLEDAIVATVYRGTEVARAQTFTGRLATLLPRIEGIRITGSPSAGACGVAAGWHDVYAFLHTTNAETVALDGKPRGQPWETAAFMVLVGEAGGAMSSLGGGPADLLGVNFYAASEALLLDFHALLATAPAPATT
jgi:myo-inositol-1(or 4)-monophosphatase